MATLIANGYKHVIGKTFKVPGAIWDLVQYYKYKAENDLVFRGLDPGLVVSSLHGMM